MNSNTGRFGLALLCLSFTGGPPTSQPAPPLVGIASRLWLVEPGSKAPLELRLVERLDDDQSASIHTTFRQGHRVLARLAMDPDGQTVVDDEAALEELLRCNSHLLDGSGGICISETLSLGTEVERPQGGPTFARVVTVQVGPGETPPPWLPEGGFEFERVMEAGRWHVVGAATLSETTGVSDGSRIVVVSRIYRLDSID